MFRRVKGKHTTGGIMFEISLMRYSPMMMSFLITRLHLVASFFNILAVCCPPRRRKVGAEAESVCLK